MIVGIGIDLTDVTRISRALDKWGAQFTRKVFSESERAFAEERADPARHYAARFAAKEATLKALGVPPGLTWQEMVVHRVGGGEPTIVLSGQAHEAAVRRGVLRLHVTLTHERTMAAAVVIAEGEGPSAAAGREC